MNSVERLRLTLSLAIVLVTLQRWPGGAKSANARMRMLGINWHTLATAQWWRLVTDVLVHGRPGLRWSILIPFVWVGAAEWHLGLPCHIARRAELDGQFCLGADAGAVRSTKTGPVRSGESEAAE